MMVSALVVSSKNAEKTSTQFFAIGGEKMSQFILDCSAIALIEQRVSRVVAARDYSSQRVSAEGPCQAYNCGCGVGGTCANSCVSGCAERGGCGPHGPR